MQGAFDLADGFKPPFGIWINLLCCQLVGKDGHGAFLCADIG